MKIYIQKRYIFSSYFITNKKKFISSIEKSLKFYLQNLLKNLNAAYRQKNDDDASRRDS